MHSGVRTMRSRGVPVTEQIRWREWSRETFEEAARTNRLVLLDLSASWCHWCHVMDETTYSDPQVIKSINEHFIPVRVDIDRRPDISERYNRGGFPTTTFLSDRGEFVWGATYVPLQDMIKVLQAILDAKSSGEVDRSLQRGRLTYLDISKARETPVVPDSEFVDAIFEDIFSDYDIEFGGFGLQQKFPQPNAVDLMLRRYSKDFDQELAEAVENTLDRMAEGLYDSEEGGVFRYSVTRDWREPHYEKMLETNIGFLQNTVRAFKILKKDPYADLARGTAGFIMNVLWDKGRGGFFGSQDADEEYYKLSIKERSARKMPAIDRSVYAGWNAEGVRSMIEAGALLGEANWVSAGRSAWKYSVEHLWNIDKGLVRHLEDNETYLFEDQVSFLRSLIAILEITNDPHLLEMADSLVRSVERDYSSPEGGHVDVLKSDEAVGELSSPRRSLKANAEWAEAIALLGGVIGNHDLTKKAWDILQSFSRKEVEAHGVFASPYVSAWWTLAQGPMVVEIHGSAQVDPTSIPLWLAAKEALNPATVAVVSRDHTDISNHKDEPFAVVCTIVGCSGKITDASELRLKLKPVMASQI
jgi:uncharacterized protein YyaL (SSP411 family)